MHKWASKNKKIMEIKPAELCEQIKKMNNQSLALGQQQGVFRKLARTEQGGELPL